ncbi:MAG TPA: phosphoribosylamine--glycine ligase [Nitrospiria bacterium]|nr:phosphoribosylamine--glycine ligase [Nitrospiria bacterium]
MKVLVIGSGGREHALVWKISQSKRVKKIYSAPGNPGISRYAECIDIRPDDILSTVDFVRKNRIDLTVVGPELPLTLGIVDLFEKEALPIFGPTKSAAEIEGSKVFSKRMMRTAGVPTADAVVFDSREEAISYIKGKGFPIVIKADGLAQGKGVVIANDMNEACSAIDSMLVKGLFGDAGRRIIIEDYLEGDEATFLVFTDGETIVPMVSSEDHKRVYDGDRGPNTGGMGAIAPSPFLDKEGEAVIIERIIRPVIRAMEEEGRGYRGILYTGLMICKDGPRVLEFNARFGDPEAEAVLPLLDTDLVDIIESIIAGRLNQVAVRWRNGASACVVLASKGYPGAYTKGVEIKGLSGINDTDELMVFHAGTSIANGRLVTSGGRVLCVTAVGKDIADARDRAYLGISKIDFDGIHFRKDIGAKAISKKESLA